jgi:hypothetical protein
MTDRIARSLPGATAGIEPFFSAFRQAERR